MTGIAWAGAGVAGVALYLYLYLWLRAARDPGPDPPGWLAEVSECYWVDPGPGAGPPRLVVLLRHGPALELEGPDACEAWELIARTTKWCG